MASIWPFYATSQCRLSFSKLVGCFGLTQTSKLTAELFFQTALNLALSLPVSQSRSWLSAFPAPQVVFTFRDLSNLHLQKPIQPSRVGKPVFLLNSSPLPYRGREFCVL